jgi:hypothetical protein
VRATRPGQSALLLLDAVEILRREGVDYLVIGAFALSVYGAIRATRDVDALLYTSIAELTRLRELCVESGVDALLRLGDADDPIPAMLVLSDAHGNQVDLLGGLRGLDPNVFSRGIDVPFLGVALRIVGREDLIAMKCFAGGPQDLIDAQSAYRDASGPVNMDLLRTVTRRYGRDAADRLEQILDLAVDPPRAS